MGINPNVQNVMVFFVFFVEGFPYPVGEPIHLSGPSSRSLLCDNARKYSVVSTSAAGE